MAPAKLEHPDMIYRFLGRSGLRVSAISLGGWLTHGGHTGDETALDTIKAAYDGGVNFFDSAEGYAGGRAELLLGRAVRHFGWDRDDLVISTKIYWGEHEDGSKGINDLGLSRKHVLTGMRKSLKRLQMDYVDLVYAHRPDKYTPMEEVVRAFNYLIESGQAMYWGTSEWSAEEIQDAWRVAEKLSECGDNIRGLADSRTRGIAEIIIALADLIGPVMEQPEYSMLHRDRVEREYAPLYRKHGLGLTIFSPLMRGILTGKYTHGIPEDSRANKSGADWFRQQITSGKPVLDRVARLEPIASKIGATTGQLALAWAVKNENVSSAIIGATSVKQIEENLSALKFVDKLTPEILEEVEAVLENKPKLPPMRFT